jgi:hypothetical protein
VGIAAVRCLKRSALVNLSAIAISVADPCHFGVDPDPDLRIHASD